MKHFNFSIASAFLLLSLFLGVFTMQAQFTQLGADIDGEADFDFSGESVSLSADGSRMAIGASGNDGNGNTGTASCQVHVPHSKKSTAIDDGMSYEEECNKSSFASFGKEVATLFDGIAESGQQYTLEFKGESQETRRKIQNSYAKS